MSDQCYVDKKHYDNLFSAFSSTKVENTNFKKAFKELKEKTLQFDDRVLEDIHRFDSLQEENAYLIGSFNTLLAMRFNIEELEEKYNVKTDC